MASNANKCWRLNFHPGSARNSDVLPHTASTASAELQQLPVRYEEVTVRVTSSGDFTLRKVFYTVSSQAGDAA